VPIQEIGDSCDTLLNFLDWMIITGFDAEKPVMGKEHQ
jgi:hypothetical protein